MKGAKSRDKQRPGRCQLAAFFSPQGEGREFCQDTERGVSQVESNQRGNLPCLGVGGICEQQDRPRFLGQAQGDNRSPRAESCWWKTEQRDRASPMPATSQTRATPRGAPVCSLERGTPLLPSTGKRHRRLTFVSRWHFAAIRTKYSEQIHRSMVFSM